MSDIIETLNHFGQELSNSINKLPPDKREGLSVSELTDILVDFLSARLDERGEESEAKIPSRYKEICNNLGLTPEVIDNAIELSYSPEPFTLESRVSRSTESSVPRMLSVLEEVIDGQGSSLFQKHEEYEVFRKNAWFCATFIYAMWKIRSFEDVTKKFDENLNKYIDWLLTEPVFLNNEHKKGWNDGEEGNNSPMLHDTAFVTNILVRIKPERPDTLYEELIDTILEMPRDKMGWWLSSDGNIDYAGTSYVLRLFGNYIERRPDKIAKKGFKKDLQTMCERLCYTVADELLGSGKLFKQWQHEVGPKELSSAGKIALLIHALRSAGKPRNWPPILIGCNWLLDQLECFKGVWCWTVVTKKGKVCGVYDSSIIVASLLRSSTHRMFSKAEAVVNWLADQVEDTKVRSTPYLGHIVCALADYLRAWQIRDFFS